MITFLFLWGIASSFAYLIVVGMATVINAIINRFWRNES